MTADVQGVASSLGLDAVCAVEVRRAAFDTTVVIKGVDNGLAEDLGTLVRVRKLVENALLFYELVFSVHAFGAEICLSSLGLVSRVVPGPWAEAERAAIVEFSGVVMRKGPCWD